MCTEQLSMTEMSYIVARMFQHFDRMESPEGQDNLIQGYKILVDPKDGVRVRLQQAAHAV